MGTKVETFASAGVGFGRRKQASFYQGLAVNVALQWMFMNMTYFIVFI